MKQEVISVGLLEFNTGQVPGLPRNPRKISEERKEALRKSIMEAPEMLEYRTLLVYPQQGKYVVVCGNMRLAACLEMGYTEMPCMVLDKDTPPEALRRYATVDNVNFGEDDFDILFKEWDVEEVMSFGKDLNIELPDEQEDKPVKNVEVPDDVEQICEKGDIWRLGKHRLMCGDSMDGASVALLMGGERADITFSSPPYNIGVTKMPDLTKYGKPTYALDGKLYNEYSDNVSDEEYSKLLLTTLDNGMMFTDAVLFNIGILAGTKIGIINLLNERADKFCDMLFWNKNISMPLGLESQRRMVSHIVEPIFCFNHEGNRNFPHATWEKGTMTNRIDSVNASGNEFADVHKATFPIEFAAEVVRNFTEESVLDLFGGTGTTMIAAEQLGRRCFMMELDPRCCDIIIARWEKMTGQKAERAEHE